MRNGCGRSTEAQASAYESGWLATATAKLARLPISGQPRKAARELSDLCAYFSVNQTFSIPVDVSQDLLRIK